jgi:hypothetical protein
MKIKITKPGIFGKDGELAIGSEIEVSKEPIAWAGRYEVISGDPVAGAELVTGAEPENGDTAEPEKVAEAAKEDPAGTKPEEPAKVKPAAVSVARKAAK